MLKAVGKIQRFGMVATDPKTGITYDNRVDLLAELSDLKHAIAETERWMRRYARGQERAARARRAARRR